MEATGLFQAILFNIGLHHEAYKLAVEAATVALLGYVGVKDFRTFTIDNASVLALLVLYIVYALLARSVYEIVGDVVLGLILFAVLLWLYRKGSVGGGDVKFMPVIYLWVGTHCALLFSVLLLVCIGLHLIAIKIGWAPADTIAGRRAIPYAPSLAAALIGTIILGCT